MKSSRTQINDNFPEMLGSMARKGENCRPASCCHGIVSVVRLSVSSSVRPQTFPLINSSETNDWFFTKFHRNVPYVVLFQIPSNNHVP